MDEINVCPRCNRYTDPDQDTCPYCGSAFIKSNPSFSPQTASIPDNSYLTPDDEDGSVLLRTHPERVSFFSRYLQALSPVFLVILCIFVRRILENIFHVASSSLISAVPGSLTPLTTGVINQYSSPLANASDITLLFIAPVGIFIVFAAIGWTMRLTEVWASTTLTLGLSGGMGIVLTYGMGVSPTSGNDMMLILQWIAFLVQPFCIIAAIIVILATEKFRRSLQYTITREGLWIRGGFTGMQEHMIPHHQIGRIVLEQDFLGTYFNYGTLIPQSSTRWGAETSLRGIGAGGQKDNFGIGMGFAKGREEGSRSPLDCFYGIPEPKKAQKILTELICRQDKREEEQVSYLKKMYEAQGADKGEDESIITPISYHEISPGSRLPGMDDRPGDGIGVTEEFPERPESTIINIHDGDTVPATSASFTGTIREIPPGINAKPDPATGIPSPESVFDQIKKLAELKDAGIITEHEFTAKKTELLKRL